MTTTCPPRAYESTIDATPAGLASAGSGVHHAARSARPGVSAWARTAYAVGGLAALTATVLVASHGQAQAVTLAVVFGIAPDLPLVFGMGRWARVERGRLHPRAVPLYNGTHRLVGPVVLLAAALAFRPVAGLAVAGLAWLAHVLVDRACGYGLRARDGWQRA